MSHLVSRSLVVNLIDSIDNMKIIQPYEVDQILMPEFANCLSVRTYLNMCDLKYQTEFKYNAEYMSPSGEVPFLQMDSVIISELEPIINFLNLKGKSLSKEFPPIDLSDMKALISYVKNHLGNSLLYLTWMDNEIYNQVTYPRYSCPYKWPLSYLLPTNKRSKVSQLLNARGWLQKSVNEVYSDVEEACTNLSNKLANKSFFFNDKPCELDALVFGYVYTLLTTKLPTDTLSNIVASHQNLTAHCKYIHETYFNSN